MPFGKVLKSLRTRNKLTQKQLADVLHVSESRIGMYEREQREPDFEMLEIIADYFNVDMDYLTGRSQIERQYSFSSDHSLPLIKADEAQLLDDYRNAEEPIRQAAAVMLHDSAERNREDKKRKSGSAG